MDPPAQLTTILESIIIMEDAPAKKAYIHYVTQKFSLRGNLAMGERFSSFIC
jgi:hypothetical protein